MLDIPNPPAELTIIYPTSPERPRHDGFPARPDPRLWVLLHDGAVWLLPPLTDDQTDLVRQTVLQANVRLEVETLIDRSNTQIATFYSGATPPDLFAPRSVIETPLDEVFDGNMRLVGYTLPSRDLVAGSVIYATLYWQPIVQASEDYEVFVQIWDDAGTSLDGAHDFPHSGMYRSRIWRMDEIVPTHHWLALPNELPIGRYTLIAGLFRQLENERVPVTGAASDVSQNIVRQPMLRVPPPPPTRELPAPAQPLTFGDLQVVGLAVRAGGEQAANAPLRTTAGQSLTLDIQWESDALLGSDYNVFVHLSPAPNAPPSAQIDATIGGGLPTSVWLPGERYDERLSLTLPDGLISGTYILSMGVYEPITGERLLMPQGSDQFILGDVMID
jgi:hypothetical protein